MEKVINDNVNNPKHYQADNLSCIDVMLKLYGKEAVLNFCMLNSFKYQWRCNKKSNCIEDLKKAKWYMNKFLELLETEDYSSNPENKECNNKSTLLKDGLTHREVSNILNKTENEK